MILAYQKGGWLFFEHRKQEEVSDEEIFRVFMYNSIVCSVIVNRYANNLSNTDPRTRHHAPFGFWIDWACRV